MHGCVFLGCVDSLDSSKGIGQSVEVKHILNMDQSGKSLVMPLSLPLHPNKYLPVFEFNLLIVIFDSLRHALLVFCIIFDMLPDTANGSPRSHQVEDAGHSI